MTEDEKKIFTNPDVTPTHSSVITPHSPEPMNPIENFIIFLRSILFSPRVFFKNLKPYEHKLSYALAFALIINWAGSFFSYFWEKILLITPAPTSQFNLNGFSFQTSSRSQPFSNSSSLLNWIEDILPIILNPFITLAVIFLSGFIIYIAARLFIPNEKLTRVDRQLNFESIVKIICFTSAPGVFLIVPFIGSSISVLYTSVLLVMGIYYCFQISIFRALIIAFFPLVLMFLIFILAGLALLTLLVSLVISAFYFFI